MPILDGDLGRKMWEQWADSLPVTDACKLSLYSGTKIEAVRSWGGVCSYVAKYICKPVSWVGSVGKYWGIHNRKKIPLSKVEDVSVGWRVAIIFKRTVRRYLRSKGIRRASRGRTVRLITNDMANWLRVASWACDVASGAQHPF